MYLAAAGVGSMTIIDNDCVETSNLQRQIQFSTSTVGKEKSEISFGKTDRYQPKPRLQGL